MEKNVEVSLLLDFYGQCLTERQLGALRAHYDDDLSLAEIADQYGISRQGVRDALVRGEAQLEYLESRLHIAHKYLRAAAVLDELEAADIDDKTRQAVKALRDIWEE